ncbi:MAG: hypothetical protein F9K22_13065 [Bacteroidetes bacterium]|nr:MAG: hypothetical protein F9K22_13065 [Bacteroidota bacterium]
MRTFIILFALLAADTLTAQTTKHSIELSPISPMFHIYAVQYSYHLDELQSAMVGVSYADMAQRPASERQPRWMDVVITPNTVTRDIGQNHSWTLFFGYKRYVYGRLHLEYQLWPGYNSFYSTTEKRYYNGFDLWNEFRVGYTFDIGDSPWYVNLQYLVGFGLIEGNKPADFGEGSDPVFRAPVFFVGYRF